MLDYHMHIWPHGADLVEPSLDQLTQYSERASELGIERIAITEHSHRFMQVDDFARGFWDAYDDSALAAASERVWMAETGADLDTYCDTVLEAQRAGLPVELGIEVDFIPHHIDALRNLLDQYPFDVRLGSVHWIDAWLFDDYGNEAVAQEWNHRGAESAWKSYEASLNDLAQAELCEVVAHCDLIKVAGRYPDPAYRRDFEDRLVGTLANSGLVVEVSSAGWRKLAGEAYPSSRILAGLAARNVPITLGSDAHRLDHIGWEYPRLVSEIQQAGFTHVTSFRAGQREMVAISDRIDGPS